jgi:CubicO group peptidase (beta-lactamase class C family)
MMRQRRAEPVARLVRCAVLCVAIGLTLAACKAKPPSSMPPERPPMQLADTGAPHWPSATLAEAGIDEAPLRRALNELPAPGEHGLRSMLVVRHGKLVAEQYWNGADRNTAQDLMSATKSITALLLGIALDKGLVGALTEPMMKTLAAAYPNVAPDKQTITLEHLLLMRSGLDCDDRQPESPGHEARMNPAQDWVRFFLDLPAIHPAGSVTAYCSAGVITLGRVIERAAGEPIATFAQRHLFGPLGIGQASWGHFDEGRGTDTGAHLVLRPREMALIGQLVLQQGQWQGRQLISREWIANTTREHTRINRNKPYGYLWWRDKVPARTGEADVVFASGGGGQMIFVVPALDLVVVFTGANFNSPKVRRTHELLRQVARAVSGAAP